MSSNDQAEKNAFSSPRLDEEEEEEEEETAAAMMSDNAATPAEPVSSPAATITTSQEEESQQPPAPPSVASMPTFPNPDRFTKVETERFGTIYVEKDEHGETVGLFDGQSGVPLDQVAGPSPRGTGVASLPSGGGGGGSFTRQNSLASAATASTPRVTEPIAGASSLASGAAAYAASRASGGLDSTSARPSGLLAGSPQANNEYAEQYQQDEAVSPTPPASDDTITSSSGGGGDNNGGNTTPAVDKDTTTTPLVQSTSFHTERFGDVTVEKDDHGKTLRVYDSSLFPGSLEKSAAAATTPSSLDQQQLSHPTPASAAPAVAEPVTVSVRTVGNLLAHYHSDDDEDDELFEFGNPKKMSWQLRWWYSIERDCYNWYGSIVSLMRQGWGFESFMSLFFGVGSTCFFCYYRTPEGKPLAARLDFSIIGSAVVFPVTFLIAETFRRRENAIQRLASIKAILCQIELGMLTWRWQNAPYELITDEWEDSVHSNLHVIINSIAQILRLPTWNTNRHIFTRQGREFKSKVIARERELTRKLSLCFSQLHWFTEDLKDWGLPASEASRINQYNSLLQIEFENLTMIKAYRTPNVSRSFVRIMILIMPIFYGAYFGWVSGTIQGGAQTNPAFAIALTVVTVMVLQWLVASHRALEDPWVSKSRGDVIDLRSEVLDTETRLNLIRAGARERRRAMLSKLTG